MTTESKDVSTYRADSVNEAIVKVKMELGDSAEIVETREVTEGGVFGFFGETRFEVDAYVPPGANTADSELTGPDSSSNAQADQQELQRRIEHLASEMSPEQNGTDKDNPSHSPDGGHSPGTSSNGRNGDGHEWNVDDPVMPEFSARDRAKQLIEEKSESMNGSSQTNTYDRQSMNNSQQNGFESPGQSSKASAESWSKESEEEIDRLVEKTDLIAEKVDSLVDSVEEESPRTEQTSSPDFPGKLNDLYHQLLGQDVEKKYARDLIGRVRKQLEAEEFHEMASIRQQVEREIEEEFEPPATLATDKDDPLLVPFVGPTGVGKTTTIAKLAAYYSVEESRSVGFITLDGYRLAAVEQLRRYAEILRVPLRDVTDLDNIDSAIDELVEQNVEMIFVDTAGRSQFDQDKIQEIEDIFPEQFPVETHLVVSAKCRSQDLKSVLDGFERIGYDRLAVTKMDETEAHGTIYNLMQKSDRPMAYFTDGQDVPDDLWIAEPDLVSNFIVEGTEE